MQSSEYDWDLADTDKNDLPNIPRSRSNPEPERLLAVHIGGYSPEEALAIKSGFAEYVEAQRQLRQEERERQAAYDAFRKEHIANYRRERTATLGYIRFRVLMYRYGGRFDMPARAHMRGNLPLDDHIVLKRPAPPPGHRHCDALSFMKKQLEENRDTHGHTPLYKSLQAVNEYMSDETMGEYTGSVWSNRDVHHVTDNGLYSIGLGLKLIKEGKLSPMGEYGLLTWDIGR